MDLIKQIPVAMKVFAKGVEAFVNDPLQVSYYFINCTNVYLSIHV